MNDGIEQDFPPDQHHHPPNRFVGFQDWQFDSWSCSEWWIQMRIIHSRKNSFKTIIIPINATCILQSKHDWKNLTQVTSHLNIHLDDGNVLCLSSASRVTPMINKQLTLIVMENKGSVYNSVVINTRGVNGNYQEMFTSESQGKYKSVIRSSSLFFKSLCDVNFSNSFLRFHSDSKDVFFFEKRNQRSWDEDSCEG